MPTPTILVHGHRGARAARPENTLAAFEYAIAAGVDVLELDLGVTRDNVVVVSHDPVLPAATCQGPPGLSAVIRELTLEQLRQWDCGSRKNPAYPKQQPVPGTKAPTLDEVFALAPGGRFQFNIETKIFRDKPEYTPPPEEFARLVLAAIRRHRIEKRVIVQSFDFRTLQAMKKLAPEIRLSALIERWCDFVEAAREAGAGIISPQFRLVTADQVKAAHAAGLEVVPWTANEPGEWEALAAAGVDAIITDDPAELIAWLKRHGLR
jgi:glycerophosphoryl diester phosphodiesterase